MVAVCVLYAVIRICFTTPNTSSVLLDVDTSVTIQPLIIYGTVEPRLGLCRPEVFMSVWGCICIFRPPVQRQFVNCVVARPVLWGNTKSQHKAGLLRAPTSGQIVQRWQAACWESPRRPFRPVARQRLFTARRSRWYLTMALTGTGKYPHGSFTPPHSYSTTVNAVMRSNRKYHYPCAGLSPGGTACPALPQLVFIARTVICR
jgi:hypothetical protein